MRERYGDRVTVTMRDPREIFSVWDNIRYGVKVRPSVPAWILDKKKIFDGIPSLSDLQSAIDKNLAVK